MSGEIPDDERDLDGRPDSVATDWTTFETPSVAVVLTVACVLDSHPTDLPPLYDVADPDALDAVLTGGSGDGQTPVRVSFTYAETRVELTADGGITVRPLA